MLFGAVFSIVQALITPFASAATNVPQNSQMNYSYIQHDISSLDLSDVINMECIMEANQTKRRLDTPNNPDGVDEFELLTIVNFYRKDSPNVFVYSPNYYGVSSVPAGATFEEYAEKGIPKEAFTVNSLGDPIPTEYKDLMPNCKKVYDYIGKKINNEGNHASLLEDSEHWVIRSAFACGDEYVPGKTRTSDPTVGVSSYSGTCDILRKGYDEVSDIVKVDYNNFYFTREDGGTTVDFIFYVQDIDGGSPKSRNAPVISDVCLLTSDTGDFNSLSCDNGRNGGAHVRANITEAFEEDGEPFRYHYGIYTNQNLTNKYIRLRFTICPSTVGLSTSAGCETVSKNGKGSTFLSNATTAQWAKAIFASITDTGDCYNASGSDGNATCEIIAKGDSFAEKAFTEVEKFFANDVGDMLENARGANGDFRALANALLTIFFIICIISQVTGLGLSHYGVKALMPKLIVVGILVNLSFEICQIIIDFTTIIGGFIKNVMAGLAGGGTAAANATWSQLLKIGVAGGALSVLVGVFEKSTIIPMLLAILGVVISLLFLLAILAIRKALITVLVIVAPVAFACYALPGTKSIYNKWASYFKNAIMIYPISMALLYGGAAVSNIMMSNSSGDFFMGLTGTFAAIAPIFMIPKAVSSSVGAISGMVGKAQGKLTGMAKGGASSVLSRSGLQRAADRQKQRRADSFQLKNANRQNKIDQKAIDRAGRFNESRLGQTAVGKKLFGNHLNDMAGTAAVRAAGYQQAQQAKAAALGVGASVEEDFSAIDAAGGIKTKNGFNTLMGRMQALNAQGDSAAVGKLEGKVGIENLSSEDAENYFTAQQAAFKGVDASRELYAKKNLDNIKNGDDIITYEQFINDSSKDGYAQKVDAKYGKKALTNQTEKSLLAQEQVVDGRENLKNLYSNSAVAEAISDTEGRGPEGKIFGDIYESLSDDRKREVNDTLSAASFVGMSPEMIKDVADAERAVGGQNIVAIAQRLQSKEGAEIFNKMNGAQQAAVREIWQPPAPTPTNAKGDSVVDPAPAPAPSEGSSEGAPSPAPEAAPAPDMESAPIDLTQSARPTISGEELAQIRTPVVSDFKYEENGQTKYNEDAIYTSPQFREMLKTQQAENGDLDTDAMMMQMAKAKSPEEMRRIVNGFDMQFKVRNGNESGLRSDGRSANDLKNDIFDQFIGQVDKNEKAQTQATQQPQMGTIEVTDITSAYATEARKARAEAQARQINEAVEPTTGYPPAPKIEMGAIESNSKAQEQAYWYNIHKLAESADPTHSNPAPQMYSVDNLTLMAAKVDARETNQRAAAEQERAPHNQSDQMPEIVIPHDSEPDQKGDSDSNS